MDSSQLSVREISLNEWEEGKWTEWTVGRAASFGHLSHVRGCLACLLPRWGLAATKQRSRCSRLESVPLVLCPPLAISHASFFTHPCPLPIVGLACQLGFAIPPAQILTTHCDQFVELKVQNQWEGSPCSPFWIIFWNFWGGDQSCITNLRRFMHIYEIFLTS